jgi:chaperonin GroES
MKIQPLNDLILIKLVEADEKTSGGIIIPDTAKEAPAEGIVEAIAAGASEEITIGDRVIYRKFAGDEMKLDGTDYKLVPVGDLLAKYAKSDSIPE